MDAQASASRNNVYLIGDLTFTDVGQGLQTLIARGDSVLLRTFFSSAASVLKQEVYSLGSALRAEFPRFSNVQDLAVQSRVESLHPALHKALVCIYHLAIFIRCVSKVKR